jgi:hypothetical protein
MHILNDSGKTRGPESKQAINVPESDITKGIATELPSLPFSVELRGVLPSEVTKKTIAAEALLSAATHSSGNTTYSILSLSSSSSSSSDIDDTLWSDELLKSDGPELLRIPLRYASVSAVNAKLGRLAIDIGKPNNEFGLITRVKTERFSNGAKLSFQPFASGYTSKDEEKALEKEKNETIPPPPPPKKTGYISPEEEAQEEARQEAISMDITTTPRIMSATEIAAKRKANQTNSKKKSKGPSEGGLEVIVESKPWARVRVRRCDMDRDSIPKEESEGIILKALESVIRGLEKDYQIRLKQQSS